MKDCFGRDIKPGDIVAYASNCNGPLLNVGEVIGPTKCGSDRLRVKVFKSQHYNFRYGLKRTNWRSPTREVIVKRQAGEPYTAVIGMPERVIIIGDDVRSFKPA